MKPSRRGREQRLAECPHVEHDTRRIDALQGRKRAFPVVELSVVVVLDDERARRLGGAQQGEATLQAERHAERLLVHRGDEGEPEVRGLAQPVVDDDSILVDRQRDERRTARDQAVAGADGARILEPDPVAGVEQDAADQIECLLRAAHDDHLFRPAGDVAGGAKVRGDGSTQRQVPQRVSVPHDVLAPASPVPGGQTRPQSHRKGVEVRQRRREAAGLVGQPLADQRRSAGDGARQPRCARRLGRRSAGGRYRRCRAVAVQHPAHEGPGPDPRLREVLRREPLVRHDDGGPRDAQLPGQGPGGGQPIPRRQAAGEDQVAQRDVELRSDRFAGTLREVQREQQGPARPLDHRRPPESRMWSRIDFDWTATLSRIGSPSDANTRKLVWHFAQNGPFSRTQ